MDKKEILHWNEKYDRDHPWWIRKEKELGDKFRKTKTLTKDDLRQIVDWKFKGLPGRRKRILRLVDKNDDDLIQKTCSQVFRLTPSKNGTRVENLDTLAGVGPALASTILTFYDPKNYGVHDIHVWRELFGPEPPTMFIGSACYLKLLEKLRKIAKTHSLHVRTVEKAHFKKNLDKPT